jgi:hypothetical protein
VGYPVSVNGYLMELGSHKENSAFQEFIRGRRGNERWCAMAASHTVIAIKFVRMGEWEADEGAGVRSSFASKQQAINYGIQRIAFHRAELRIHDEDGNLERTIAFNEAGDLIPRH